MFTRKTILLFLPVALLLLILPYIYMITYAVITNAAPATATSQHAITPIARATKNPKPIATNATHYPISTQPTITSSPLPTNTLPTLTNTFQATNTQLIIQYSSETPKPTRTKHVVTNNPTSTNTTPIPTHTSGPTNIRRPTKTAATKVPTQTQVIPPINIARQKIKHIIMIMQENRSFDHYFGTYPGADGIPMRNGVPTVCSVDPKTNICQKPYHNPNDINFGGPHNIDASRMDVNKGKMNGFIKAFRDPNLICIIFNSDNCSKKYEPDVMGWHDQREIPNYWAYAQNFVLQDRMFEPTNSWSLTAHLFMVSSWSAYCTERNNPFSCTNAPDGPLRDGTTFAWTDITYLLHKKNISWAYYLSNGIEPDCQDDSALCEPVAQSAQVPGIWNPLPKFDTVRENGQLGNIQSTKQYYLAAQNGTLPAVSWIIPNHGLSEHPRSSVHAGEAYVTGLVNAAMQGPDWESTVIFISWDDWGGFYDHVRPPVVDKNGYGIRVPGLMISPYARHGYIDHQTLSFDAYLKFIEDIFLDGERLDPLVIDRPDPRPTVRENLLLLGNLLVEFNFGHPPRKPLLLPVDSTYGPVWTRP